MTDSPAARPLTPRGEATRSLILHAGLSLLAERGYDATTMRAVAARAGVSLGNAYYYFRSKDELVAEFYRRSHGDHLQAFEPELARHATLAGRLRALALTKLDTLQPHHRFAAQLFRVAADPDSGLNPWSEASRPLREDAIALFGRVVDGSDVRPPEDLRRELPWLLWTWEMGLILFWIHDRSPGCVRSRRLAERTSDLVATLVRLAGNPLLRPLRAQALDLVRELRTPDHVAEGSRP